MSRPAWMAEKCIVGVLIFSLMVISVFGKELFTLQEVEAIAERAAFKANAALLKKISDLDGDIKSIQGHVSDLENAVQKQSADKKEPTKRLVLDEETDLQQTVMTLQQKVQALETSSGFAGGSWYSSYGGSNYVCLTSEPTWGVYVDGDQTGSNIYGAEYEHWTFYTSAQFASFFGNDVAQNDVPCAVCRSSRPTTIMIPGRDICYPGWTKEYSGYLMSSMSDHAGATEFVCMDVRPEVILHGQENKDGALFYLTEAVCGSLSCPPYIEGRELTCVVCSK